MPIAAFVDGFAQVLSIFTYFINNFNLLIAKSGLIGIRTPLSGKPAPIGRAKKRLTAPLRISKYRSVKDQESRNHALFECKVYLFYYRALLLQL